MDGKIIGENIKRFRIAKKMTQQELADEIKKTKSSVQKYEKGVVEIPIKVIEQIAKVLEVDAIELIPLNYQAADGSTVHSIAYYKEKMKSGLFTSSDAFDLWLVLCETEFESIQEKGGRLYTVEEMFDKDYFFITNDQYRQLQGQALKYIKEKLISYNHENTRDPEIRKLIEETKKLDGEYK